MFFKALFLPRSEYGSVLSCMLALPRRPSPAGEQTETPRASHPSSSAAAADAQSKGRRRIPTPDLDAIEDPAERRRQQRLAKTRATAAIARCAARLAGVAARRRQPRRGGTVQLPESKPAPPMLIPNTCCWTPVAVRCSEQSGRGTHIEQGHSLAGVAGPAPARICLLCSWHGSGLLCPAMVVALCQGSWGAKRRQRRCHAEPCPVCAPGAADGGGRGA